MHVGLKAASVWLFNLAIEQRQDFWIIKNKPQDKFVLGFLCCARSGR